MIPVNSTIKHDPENGKRGDCDRACIASLLEMPIENVPHFFDYDPGEGGKAGHEIKREWLLKTLGLKWVDIPFESKDLGNMLLSLKRFVPGCHHTLTARSIGGVGHTVVVLDGVIVHDPSYRPVHGLVGDLDGYYWVGLMAFDG